VSAPSPSFSEFDLLARAWRYERAKWDLAANDPSRPEGLSNVENDEFCDHDQEALLRLLLHPAVDLRQFTIKLDAIVSEQAWRFDEAPAIFQQLAREARELRSPSMTRGAR
jgi:hypothetical protein